LTPAKGSLLPRGLNPELALFDEAGVPVPDVVSDAYLALGTGEEVRGFLTELGAGALTPQEALVEVVQVITDAPDEHVGKENAVRVGRLLFARRADLTPGAKTRLHELPLLTRGGGTQAAHFCYLPNDY